MRASDSCFGRKRQRDVKANALLDQLIKPLVAGNKVSCHLGWILPSLSPGLAFLAIDTKVDWILASGMHLWDSAWTNYKTRTNVENISQSSLSHNLGSYSAVTETAKPTG